MANVDQMRQDRMLLDAIMWLLVASMKGWNTKVGGDSRQLYGVWLASMIQNEEGMTMMRMVPLFYSCGIL